MGISRVKHSECPFVNLLADLILTGKFLKKIKSTSYAVKSQHFTIQVIVRYFRLVIK